MRHAFRALTLASLIVLLAACGAPTPPDLDPRLVPAGPVSLETGQATTFQALGFADPGSVSWRVGGVEGGSAQVGTIDTAGHYQAPARALPGGRVETEVEALGDGESAVADVVVNAPGTIYLLGEEVHVFASADTVDGEAPPQRSFHLEGWLEQYYDILILPEIDAAFLIVETHETVSVFRLEAISAALGAVEPTAGFDVGLSVYPSSLAYDPVLDELYVVGQDRIAVFSEAAAGVGVLTADRVIEGPAVDAYLSGDGRLVYDPGADRLFLSVAELGFAVFDDASTLDGDVAPDRVVAVSTEGGVFIWGLAIDLERDVVYVGNQYQAENVFVFEDASTISGLREPDRTFLEAAEGASQLSYDPLKDRLLVVDANGNAFHLFENASTLDGVVTPDRSVDLGPLEVDYPYGGRLDPTQ